MKINPYQAHIVLLVSGNSVEDMQDHQANLEQKYQDAVKDGILSLVDAPLADYAPKLKTLRCTYCPQDSYARRYRRSKQNLDIAYTLNAVTSTVHHTEFIMLLEDDTGFQPGFGSALLEQLMLSKPPAAVAANQALAVPSQQQQQRPITWGRLQFGFGCSGIVLHSSDANVYRQIHYHFFDEKPCEAFNFYQFLGDGNETVIENPTDGVNEQPTFLQHLW